MKCSSIGCGRWAKKVGDELRPEYDQLNGGVVGKYYIRAMAGTNLVLVEPDLAKAFSDTDSVNRGCVFWLMPPASSPQQAKNEQSTTNGWRGLAEGMIQKDGRIRRWEPKYLRVILLSDGETVHNAFFDRSFTP
jgi:hypothetical protein